VGSSAATFKPGASPFHINGVFYLGLRRYAEERVRGGWAGLVASLGGELAEFARQPFLATAFYDLLPLVPLIEALARLQKQPFQDFVRRRARGQARSDCDGVYRAFIGRRGSERQIFDGIVKTSARIYDFGAVEYQLVRPGVAELVRTEVPEPVLAWYQLSTAEYITAVLEHAELKDARVHCYKRDALLPRDGCRVFRLAFRAEWSPA
jgi:hypothetical protein